MHQLYAKNTNYLGEYYNRKYIQYLILEGCTGREMAFLGKNNTNVRALNVKCLFDFERSMKFVNWDKNKPNIYRSLARINKIPQFTFNPKERSKETIYWYERVFDKEIDSYDLFFDFDKDEKSTIYDVLKEVNELLDYFKSYNVPYYVLFSGNRGFQVIVDGKYLPIKKIEKGLVYPHKEIIENVKKTFVFKYLDLSHNGVTNKLCKVPYSLVGNNIALPLSDIQLDNFSLSQMNSDYVLQHIPIMRRGLLEREGNKKGVESFIKSITFKK